MGVERRAAGTLIGILHSFHDTGSEQTLRKFSCEQLIGKPPKEVLTSLVDIACQPGGTIDENIARDAYIDTILGIDEIDLDNISLEQINEIIEKFVSKSISIRLINDIGLKLEQNAFSEEQAISLESEMGDFVHGAVKDKLNDLLGETNALDPDNLKSTVSNIYKVAYDLIDEEAGRL